jgi:hypothetical protein
VNHEQTALVLAKAAGIDQRTVGAADVLAWHEIIGDLEYADALAAVSAHYAESSDRLMPAHVRRHALAIARERHRIEREIREEENAALEAANAAPVSDRSAEVKTMLAYLAERLGPADPTVLRRREWVEEERRKQREQRAAAEPNPHFAGLPPPGGWPVPDTDTA